MTGSSTYNYQIFAIDILGGCDRSDWRSDDYEWTYYAWENSIYGFNLESDWKRTHDHNERFLWVPVVRKFTLRELQTTHWPAVWYPVGTSSGTTLIFKNVPQYSATTTAGTGGMVTAFLGNALTWAGSTGGS